jgi:hypothetical protein
MQPGLFAWQTVETENAFRSLRSLGDGDIAGYRALREMSAVIKTSSQW